MSAISTKSLHPRAQIPLYVVDPSIGRCGGLPQELLRGHLAAPTSVVYRAQAMQFFSGGADGLIVCWEQDAALDRARRRNNRRARDARDAREIRKRAAASTSLPPPPSLPPLRPPQTLPPAPPLAASAASSSHSSARPWAEAARTRPPPTSGPSAHASASASASAHASATEASVLSWAGQRDEGDSDGDAWSDEERLESSGPAPKPRLAPSRSHQQYAAAPLPTRSVPHQRARKPSRHNAHS